MMSRAGRAKFTVFMACVGGIGGCVASAHRPHRVEEFPLPHHISKYPGGVSFRFAMAHDVIHERFARHGDAYYTERNRRVRRQLEDFPPAKRRDETTDELYFTLLDDLGVALEALGQRQEAVRLMRDKLREQEARGYEGDQLYTTYANLGTFLIHDNF